MKTILLLMGLSFCIISEAQTVDKPVLCAKAADLREQLEGFGERVIWLSPSPADKTSYIFYGNRESGTWTLLQIIGEAACIVGYGEALKIRDTL